MYYILMPTHKRNVCKMFLLLNTKCIDYAVLPIAYNNIHFDKSRYSNSHHILPFKAIIAYFIPHIRTELLQIHVNNCSSVLHILIFYLIINAMFSMSVQCLVLGAIKCFPIHLIYILLQKTFMYKRAN